MIVADASVVVQALVGGPGGGAARARLRRAEIAVPDILDVEVASALRGLWLAGRLDDAGVSRALADLRELAVTRYASTTLVGRALALRANLSVYDATYVALAEALGCPLVTLDRGLLGAPGLLCPVERP